MIFTTFCREPRLVQSLPPPPPHSYHQRLVIWYEILETPRGVTRCNFPIDCGDQETVKGSMVWCDPPPPPLGGYFYLFVQMEKKIKDSKGTKNE